MKEQVFEVKAGDLGNYIGKVVIMAGRGGKVVGRIMEVNDGLLTFEWLCVPRQGDTSTVRFGQEAVVRVFGGDAEISALLE